MALSLSTPEKFVEGEDFDIWLDGFEVYLCALGIEEVNRKRALLLHLLGTDIQQKLKDATLKLVKAVFLSFSPLPLMSLLQQPV